MKKLKKFILLNFILFLASCSSVQSIFVNQKKNNTDEFLVEKKSPLSMPPNFDKLPIPKSNEQPEIKDENNLETLIGISENKVDQDKDNQDINNGLEEQIIKKLKKIDVN